MFLCFQTSKLPNLNYPEYLILKWKFLNWKIYLSKTFKMINGNTTIFDSRDIFDSFPGERDDPL